MNLNSEKVALHKLKHQIKLLGSTVTYTTQEVNEFNEPIDGETKTFKGLFHRGSSPYVQVNQSDGGIARPKGEEYVTAPWTDVEPISVGSEVTVLGQKYTVQDVTNISNHSLIGQVSIKQGRLSNGL